MADEDEPTVPVICPTCETRSDVPLSEVAGTIEGHNARLHDGEAIAEVDPALTEELADLVADDLGLLED
ncbi:MAG: hypothetical protein ABEJ35_03755 [Halobacteriaceae archaeon]